MAGFQHLSPEGSLTDEGVSNLGPCERRLSK